MPRSYVINTKSNYKPFLVRVVFPCFFQQPNTTYPVALGRFGVLAETLRAIAPSRLLNQSKNLRRAVKEEARCPSKASRSVSSQPVPLPCK
jgi:hypothetical protein